MEAERGEGKGIGPGEASKRPLSFGEYTLIRIGQVCIVSEID